jgi:hypothetical protein
VATKAEAAAQAGVKQLVYPQGNDADVPVGKFNHLTGVSTLEELLACALVLPGEWEPSRAATADTTGLCAHIVIVPPITCTSNMAETRLIVSFSLALWWCRGVFLC